MMKTLILFFLCSYAYGFGSSTVKRIDEIRNRKDSDITINPTNDVIFTSGTASRVPYFDADKKLKSSSITTTELGYLSGVTSGIQVQLNTKEPTINLPINRAVFSDGLGVLATGLTTDTELGYVNGVTSSIQTQLNGKLTIPLTTDGDLYIFDTTNTRLPIGTLGQLLTVNASGLPAWLDAPVSTTLTTKGDIQTYDTANARIGVGSNGQLLSADSVETTGLKWIDPPAVTPTTTEGDLILRGAAEDERLAIGTNLQLLTSNGTTASWEDAPISTTLSAKGDIQTYDTANAAISVGNDNEVLFADSGETTGLKWADPTTMIFTVAQAEIVGKLNWASTGTCSWNLNKNTTWTNSPTNAGCNNPTVEVEGITNDGDKSMHFILPAGSPPGNYKIILGQPLANDFSGGANNGCFYRFKSANITTDEVRNFTINNASDVPTSIYQFKIDVETTVDEKFYSQTRANTNTAGQCRIGAALAGINNSLSVEYFPPRSTIVRQKTKLSFVLGGGSGSTHSLTANVTPIPWVATNDSNNEWSGTQFTASKKMSVNILGNVRFTGSSGANMFLYINGTQKDIISEANVSQVQTLVQGSADLEEGDVLEIRSNTNATINSAVGLHWMSISQAPIDVQIVGEFNQIKCETKPLNANHGIGVVSDFGISNMTIGKYYQIIGMFTSGTGTVATMTHDSKIIAYMQNSSGSVITSPINIPWIKATATTMVFTNTNSTTILGNVTDERDRSYLQVCEKSATNVTETTEF